MKLNFNEQAIIAKIQQLLKDKGEIESQISLCNVKIENAKNMVGDNTKFIEKFKEINNSLNIELNIVNKELEQYQPNKKFKELLTNITLEKTLQVKKGLKYWLLVVKSYFKI